MLHILHGGIKNGDKRWLERAARHRLSASSWIAPKASKEGDSAVIFVGSAFYATAKISSAAKPRPDWGPKRYGAGLHSVKLIDPPISLGIIRTKLPELTWAIYPRSVTTVSPAIEAKIKKFIAMRRQGRGVDVKNALLPVAGIEELRARAIADAQSTVQKNVRMTTHRRRSTAIHRYVLARADGVCEGCRRIAPFKTKMMDPYLEPHHTTRLADDGPDHPSSVIALCPTCHKRVHHSHDGDSYNLILVRKLKKLETRNSAR